MLQERFGLERGPSKVGLQGCSKRGLGLRGAQAKLGLQDVPKEFGLTSFLSEIASCHAK